MSKKTIYILVGSAIGLILLLIGLKKGGVIGNNDDSKMVEVSKVAQTTIVETVSATGKIQPEVEVKISSEVSGEVIALTVKEGQQVKKGDLLVRINPDLYESGVNRSVAAMSTTKAGLSQADAQIKETKANFDRNKKLFEKGIISKSEWDRVVSAYEVAVANKQSAYYQVQSASATVTEAKDNLGRTTIYAPADGTISLLNIELGERVLGTQQMTGTEILRIANLNNMEVEVDVNENDIIKVKEGQTVEIDVDAYSSTGKKFKGIVTEISNTANNTTSADAVTEFTVKIRILPESYKDLKKAGRSPFRPGMTAAVDIITNQQDNVVSVPISAVTTRTASQLQEKGGNSGKTSKPVSNIEENKDTKAKGLEDDVKEVVFLYNAEKGEVRTQEVSTGISDFENIQIVKGLKEGDKIVIGPFNLISKLLENGQKVTKSDDSK
jgi:HlyD family secretion protein